MSDTVRRARRTEPIDYADFPDLPIADHIPEFASDEEAAEFFDTHDISGIWDQLDDVTDNPPWVRQRSKSTGVRTRKRPPAGRMDLLSFRLPAEMIDEIKVVAARCHLPYQTLIRSWIGERLERERTVGESDRPAREK